MHRFSATVAFYNQIRPSRSLQFGMKQSTEKLPADLINFN